jgi:hypothetical protein
MKTIMLRYQELHDHDGVVLWYCFLTHFAGTTTENLIFAYSQLSESKLQLVNFQNNVLKFTNAVYTPIRTLLKAEEEPTFQHFLYVFHGAMDAPNEEFRAFIIHLYSDYRKGGPTKQLSMLDLLDKLDTEYNRINNLGRWTKEEDPHLLALTASLQTLQSQFSSLTTKYQALVAAKDKSSIPGSPPRQKLTKPPTKKANEPEITKFEGRTWKWCNKCFGGSWNHTHITEEHQPGKGRKNKKSIPANDDGKTSPPPPQSPLPPTGSALPPENKANVASSSEFEMDFL